MDRIPSGLNNDELLLVDAFVKSPIFPIMKKLFENQIAAMKESLVTEQDPNAIRVIQGRIIGVRSLHSIPEFISRIESQKNIAKREKAKQKPKK